jgi:PAS domain S-box-containing protein
MGWIVFLGWVIAVRGNGVDRSRVALLAILPILWTILVSLRGGRRSSSSDCLLESHPQAEDRTPARLETPAGRPVEEESMTSSGLYDSPSGVLLADDDGLVTGEFSIIDMVNRLDPHTFQWIDSSLAEQEFLGFVLNELKRRSFLDVVLADDRSLAEEALRLVLSKGEIHGVVVRVRTAQNQTKAVELNAGARYNAEHRVTYLRCHLTDVTEKVRAERELRRRTRELIQVNDQLRQINREVEDLKDRLLVTNQSLQRANAELSAKNRELDEFVYVVSHDLQEPLRTLTAYSDFLLRDHARWLDTEGNQYLRDLVNASKRMKSMIGGLLRLSRAGKVTDEFARLNLTDLVNVVRSDLAELIRARGADVRLLDEHVSLWGDRRRLEQLLTNLVSNGIKYNRSPVPTVEIGLYEPSGDPAAASADSAASATPGAGSLQTILVRDNGIGIDPRHHRRIFQLFRRLHTQEEFEGNGVGLAICNKIVQAHGGEIRLDSEPGKGTTFYFTLRRDCIA